MAGPVREWILNTGWRSVSDIDWQKHPAPSFIIGCPTCGVKPFKFCNESEEAVHSRRRMAVEVVITTILIIEGRRL